MQRHFALFGLVLAAGCSASQPEFVTPRTVLLGYPAPPTSADSAALRNTYGGTVTIYPLINAMTIRTGLPSSQFLNSTPKPGRITDFDSLQTAGDSLFAAIDLELTVAPTFGPADSAFLIITGFRSIYISRHLGLVEVDVSPATFPLINRLTANSTIISGQLYFDDIRADGRARANRTESGGQ
jgi:hypothetical protein